MPYYTVSHSDDLKMEACDWPDEPDGGALGQGHVRVHLYGQQSGETVSLFRLGINICPEWSDHKGKADYNAHYMFKLSEVRSRCL